MFRTTILRQARLFSTTASRAKVVPEPVRETVKKVDRTVSDQIVKGIEGGEKAAEAVKSTVGVGSTAEAKGKANEVAGEVKGKANELAGQAKGKANELAGEAKGKKEEVKGKL